MSLPEQIAIATFFIGLLLVVFVLVQVALATYAAYIGTVRQKLARSIMELAWKEECHRACERIDRNQASKSAWNGCRKFCVSKKVVEANGICSFYLKPHDHRPLPQYLPGQFLTFQVEIPDTRKGLQKAIRCYSLSSAHMPDAYRVTIKRIPKSTESPGLVSNYFHDHVHEDTILDVMAPRGKFVLDPWDHRPAVLVAGGVGITPLLSMFETVAKTASNREVWLFYGVRNGRDHVLPDQIRDLDSRHENLRAVICYSEPSAEDEQETAYDERGHITVDLLKQYIGSSNYVFYVCGPPPMIASLLPQLANWGVPKLDIRTESFGPAAIGKQAKKPAKDAPEAETGPRIEFAKSKKERTWSEEYPNLLDFAEGCGVQIPSGCLAGNCGTCQVAIRKGEVDYTAEPEFDFETGCCLPCVARPKGDVVLEA